MAIAKRQLLTMSVPEGNKGESEKSGEQPNNDALQEDIVRIIQSKGASIPAQKIREIAVSIATRFSGPIPPPHILAEYEQILPGCAHRLITAFEEQYRHRMSLESRTNRSQLSQSGLGQIMGGVIVVACLAITAWMGFLGHPALAGTLGTSTVVSLATIYFLGRRTQQVNLQTKKPKKD